ncbi:MAG: hypothetical protein U5K00_12270 [Melioribacteraceae bacterium]|nr:hypothetical protein [Melioribacteraceae bacterium]
MKLRNSKGDLISDLAFTNGSLALTNSSSVKMMKPVGGEVWGVSDGTRKIEWESVLTNNVRLRYSSNNGSSWTTIVSSISASTGSYEWTLPNINSTTCKLLIANVDDLGVLDVSDAFTITNTKSLDLVKPDGGES